LRFSRAAATTKQVVFTYGSGGSVRSRQRDLRPIRSPIIIVAETPQLQHFL
jgi:hypothetical protein